jgi:hypothetical protein
MRELTGAELEQVAGGIDVEGKIHAETDGKGGNKLGIEITFKRSSDERTPPPERKEIPDGYHAIARPPK